MKNPTSLFLALLFIPLGSTAKAADAAGGGFLNGGLTGQWFPNTELSGPPVFERSDIRIRFDWGDKLAPGGVNGNGFEKLSTDNYSVRFNGTLEPRFTETYTFYVNADDGARLIVTPEGGQPVTLVDSWNKAGTHEVKMDLVRGQNYAVKLEYVERNGAARLILEWSSEHTSREVIEAAAKISINDIYREAHYADAIRTGRYTWNNTTVDAHGWPLGDGDFIVSEILSPCRGEPLEHGHMRLTFKGKADVGGWGNGGLLPDSYKYDAATNTSTAVIVGNTFSTVNVLNLQFRNTSRNGQFDGPGGVTDVKLMRPATFGAEESFPPETLFHPAFLKAHDIYSSIRFQRVNDQAREWKERVPPFWPYDNRDIPYVYNQRYNEGKWNLRGQQQKAHEFEIMQCNALGADYYVTFPHLATYEGEGSYLQQLARLIRYGSDAEGNPYREPTANPVYPPLNPNLNVYVEESNELWNFAQLATYAPYYDYQHEVADLQAENGVKWKRLNFDNSAEANGGKPTYDHFMRWWGYRIALASDAFRAVWGDENMPLTSPDPRIRPYFGWQYSNMNRTASEPLGFIDAVLNNGAGKFVETPHPPSYYIYAGGGAGYYSAVNPFALADFGKETQVPENGGFESPEAPRVITNPKIPGWSFEGHSGIAGPEIAEMPAPMKGKQAAWLKGTDARIRFQITVPKLESPVHGLVFRAVLPKGSTVTGPALRVTVNGKDITYKGWGANPLPWSEGALWNRVAYWTGSWYFTENFDVKPGEPFIVAFEGLQDSIVFIDDVHLTSLDAFFASGIPASGAAMGQSVVAGVPYDDTIHADGYWAALYGLKYMTYEHGWSAGGDSGETPLQDLAKFRDPRAAGSVERAIDFFQEAGGINATFGTYSTWPTFDSTLREEGIFNVDTWPLYIGQKRILGRLPGEPVIAPSVPATLDGAAPNGEINSAGGRWLGYTVFSPKASIVPILVELSEPTDVGFSLNDRQILASATGVTKLKVTAPLQSGINSLRVLLPKDSKVAVRSIQVGDETTLLPAMAKPTATLAGGSTLEVKWTSPQAGPVFWFEIRHTAPGIFAGVKVHKLGNQLTWKVDNAPPATGHTFAIRAYTAKGLTQWSPDVSLVVPAPPPLDEVFAFEPFTGPAGRLENTATGRGWASGWGVQSDEKDKDGFEIRTVSPLSPKGGAYATGGQAYRSSGRLFNLQRLPSWMISSGTRSRIGRPGTEVWLGAKIRPQNPAGASECFLATSNSDSPPDSNAWRAGVTIRNGKWTLWAADSREEARRAYLASALPANAGETARVALRFQFGVGETTVSLYLNPDSPAAAPVATLKTSDLLAFQTFVFNPGADANTGDIDDIALAGTFAALLKAQTGQ